LDYRFLFIIFIEAISKIEKWFEVKPPARGAYAPEGTAKRSEEFRPVVGTSSKLSARIAGRTEIGPSMLLRVVSQSNEPFGIFEMASNTCKSLYLKFK
jgi:hypothetical protein